MQGGIEKMINTKTENEAFWLGDLIEYRGQKYFINEIKSRYLDGVLCLTEEFHPAWTLGYFGIPEQLYTELEIIERGNFYLNAQGLPLKPFATPTEEAYFRYALDEAEIPKIEVNTLNALLQKVREGELDGYFTTETFFFRHFVEWHGIKLKNEIAGRELAQKTLDHHKYKVVQRKLQSLIKKFA